MLILKIKRKLIIVLTAFPYDYFVQYLNTPDVQKAIGAYQNFSTSSQTVSSAFGNTGDDDRESGTIEACQKLLEAGVQVMLYYGDAYVSPDEPMRFHTANHLK
jgi:hypothetical protein